VSSRKKHIRKKKKKHIPCPSVCVTFNLNMLAVNTTNTLREVPFGEINPAAFLRSSPCDATGKKNACVLEHSPLFDRLAMKIKPVHSCETSVTIHHLIRCNIQTSRKTLTFINTAVRIPNLGRSVVHKATKTP
jgi:hypothetical protein